jgi:hypothetical protein
MSLAYTDNGTTTTYLGRTAFAENSQPQINESQFGLDYLTRTFIGAAPLLAAFIESLTKGGIYTYNGDDFYLISWSEDGDKLWPTVSLQYIGLSRGNPPPLGEDDYSPQSVTVTATVDSDDPDAEDGATMTVERTIDYIAGQTTWRYTTLARPTTLLVGTTSQPFVPIILRSRITTSTGHTYAGANAPANLVIATTPAIQDQLLSLTATPQYSTPFFEVTETIGRLLVG